MIYFGDLFIKIINKSMSPPPQKKIERKKLAGGSVDQRRVREKAKYNQNSLYKIHKKLKEISLELEQCKLRDACIWKKAGLVC